MSGLLLNFLKSLYARPEEIRHTKNQELLSSFPKPFSHSTTKGQRRESHLPLPREDKSVRFYCITVAEVNTWMCHREGRVSNIRGHLSHRTRLSLPLALSAHGPHGLLSSREHCWTQLGQSRKQGTCHREGHCLEVAYCYSWRWSEP